MHIDLEIIYRKKVKYILKKKRLKDRHLKKDMLISIAHVIQYANCQLYRLWHITLVITGAHLHACLNF